MLLLTTKNSFVLCTGDTQRDVIIVGCTHYESCDMLLTLDSYHSSVATDTW